MVNIKQGESDYWAWKWDSSGHYTVRSAYHHLVPLQQTQLKGIFNLVWNRSVPLKVAALAWRALHDRLPTKCNLARRDIIKDRRETICSRCLENEETLCHLFFDCMQSWKVWASCYYWWGISSVSMQNINEHFKQYVGLIGNIKFTAVWMVIWYAVKWSIWLQRNKVTFNDGQVNEEELVEMVKYRSFYWVRANLVPDLSIETWKADSRATLKRY
ncbi:hypothetical protein SLE2022_155580 [Rubroshorea leprosula]